MLASKHRDYTWPGFVDCLAALLMVLMFILLVFITSQFALRHMLAERDDSLSGLRSHIASLTQQLSLAHQEKANLADNLGQLRAQLQVALGKIEAQKATTLELQRDLGQTLTQAQDTQIHLDKQLDLNDKQQTTINDLSSQLTALNQQISALNQTLDAWEEKDRQSQATIINLGKRLNAALASKAQELARYRSEFFGQLRAILADRADVKIVGDRFVFSSQILFDSGQADLKEKGLETLEDIAQAVKDIAVDIPNDIDWVIQIEGHTDAKPISTNQFPSNWELSTARALSVVRFLIDQDIPAKHLSASGFGLYHPLIEGNDAQSYAQNRRIEIKLTQR